ASVCAFSACRCAMTAGSSFSRIHSYGSSKVCPWWVRGVAIRAARGGTGGVPAGCAGMGRRSVRSLTCQRYSSIHGTAQVDRDEAGCKDSSGVLNGARLPGELFVRHASSSSTSIHSQTRKRPVETAALIVVLVIVLALFFDFTNGF